MHNLPAPALEAAVVKALQMAVESQTSKQRQNDSGVERETIDPTVASSLLAERSLPTGQARSLVNTYLVRTVAHSNRLQIYYRADPADPHACDTLSFAGTKPPTHVRRAMLAPSEPNTSSRRMEGEERDRLLLAVATARSWVEGLTKGSISSIAELGARLQRTERSVRITLSLAFLDTALVDAACAGALPRGYGVTRLMDLPPIFADQWRALGMKQPN